MQTIETKIEESYHCREPYWSEALAIGDGRWLKKVVGKISDRKRVTVELASKQTTENDDLAESITSYFAS